MKLELKPIHENLPVLGDGRFKFADPPYQLITFLNQTLKDRGLVFGLRRVGEAEYRVSVYEVSAAGAPGGPAGE